MGTYPESLSPLAAHRSADRRLPSRASSQRGGHDSYIASSPPTKSRESRDMGVSRDSFACFACVIFVTLAACANAETKLKSFKIHSNMKVSDSADLLSTTV